MWWHGADESRWRTVVPEQTVLFAGRTGTSTIQLLDSMWLFGADDRVEISFTVNETSFFSAGVREILADAGVRRLVPWRQLRRTRFGLLVSASENIDYHQLHRRQRVLVLPHGIGFNKIVPSRRGPRLAGLPPARALRSGLVKLVLAHPDQRRQLLAACPEVDGHTVVTGDPTYDRLVDSLPLAELYRHDFGTAGRRLVFLSSTWNTESQLGRAMRLAEQLLAALPADEYQLVMAAHPNVWSVHHVNLNHRWLVDAVKAGLVLLPPERGWHAALVAADLVIGDHGSVTLYAAALGKPLLLTGHGDEVVPDTPIDLLGQLARHLDLGGDLRKQVDYAVTDHDPALLAPLADRVFDHVGEAATRLRAALYGELGLEPLADLPRLRVPDARPELKPVTAFNVRTEFTGPDTLSIDRFPRAAAGNQPDQHLAVREDEMNVDHTLKASVLVGAEVMAVPEEWLARNRVLYKAAVVAAPTSTGCLAALRNGRRVTVTGELDPMLLASVVFACANENRPLTQSLTVLGQRVSLVELGP